MSAVRVERYEFTRPTFFELLKWGLSASLISLAFGIPSGIVTACSTNEYHTAGIETQFLSEGGFWAGAFFCFLFLAFRSPVVKGYFAPRPPPEEPEEPEEEDEPIPEDAIYLGTSLLEDRETPRPVYLENETRNRHVYLIGKTRTGKTSLMRNMIEQDIQEGRGLCFIDPHGDASEDILGIIPDDQVDRVIYFDPTKPFAPRFNPFALHYPPPKLAEDIVSVFKMLVGDSWGPRLEHIMRFSVMTLIADPEPHCLADLKTLLIDPAFQGDVVSRLPNRQLKEFWNLEYPTFPSTAPSPILNKLSAFLAPMSDLERVFSTNENDLDFTDIMDNGKILIVNLSKGILGDEPSRLVGGLIVAGIQQSALARASQAEHTRRDFYLYVDEFQDYCVSSFADILAESAKYRLNLTLAHQNLGQVPDYLRRSIFGNVATMIAYQISAQDAPLIAREMHRSRIRVRKKTSNIFVPVSVFADEQRDIYETALDDPYSGMPRHERYQFDNRYMINYAKNPNALKEARKDAEADATLTDRRDAVVNTLRLLNDDTIDVGALKTLFPDWEFHDDSFPTVEDFVNLPPHHGYIRIGTAENVMPLHPPKPTDPNREVQTKIMARLQKHDQTKKEQQTPLPTDPESDDDEFNYDV